MILDRRLYLGEVTWNRTRKRDRWGQKRLQARNESEWIHTMLPALRLVSDDQWQAARMSPRSCSALEKAGTFGNRRTRDIKSRYLLSGFARCGVCGGGIGVVSGSRRSNRLHAYGCLTYHKRGTSV